MQPVRGQVGQVRRHGEHQGHGADSSVLMMMEMYFIFVLEYDVYCLSDMHFINSLVLRTDQSRDND